MTKIKVVIRNTSTDEMFSGVFIMKNKHGMIATMLDFYDRLSNIIFSVKVTTYHLPNTNDYLVFMKDDISNIYNIIDQSSITSLSYKHPVYPIELDLVKFNA